MQTVENKYCLNLDLGIKFNSSLIEHCKVDPGNINHFKIDTDPELQNFLLPLDVKIIHSELFYTPPGYTLRAHIDTVNDDHCKLNFVYGGTDSLMQWWRLKDSTLVLESKFNSTGTPYIPVNIDDCDLVWSAKIGTPSLVNVGQPHSVINHSNSPRWCFSHVLADVKKKWVLQWDDAVDIFKTFVTTN